MKETLTFSVGVVARLVGVIVEKYAGWLLSRIGAGAEYSLDLVQDFRDFVRSMLQWVARQLCGRQVFAHGDYEEDYHYRTNGR
jgi:hypothetical protein